MTIKSVELFNFQSHQKTKIELDHGINIICGISDSGKSSLIRAINWVLTNRPVGDSFRSNFGGETRVVITTDTDVIERIKGKENLYKVNGLELKAPKTDVPTEVLEALNMNSINIAKQFDRPFLLDSSPGEVAAFFNQIAHLDKIDSSLSKVNGWIRELQRNIQSDETNKTELEESLRQFDNLDELDIQVTELEELDSAREQLLEDIEQLNTVITSLLRIDQQQAEYDYILQLEPSVLNIIELLASKKQLEREISSLQSLLDSIQDLDQNSQKLSLYARTDTIVTETMNLLSEKKNLSTTIISLKTAIQKIKDVNQAITRNKQELTNMEELFHKELGGICPLCSQRIA